MHILKSENPAQAFLRFSGNDELLRDIVDNAAVGLAIAAMDRTILYANAAFRKSLGYLPDDTFAAGVDGLYHEDDAERCLAVLETMRAAGTGSCRSEVRFKRKDGSAAWMLASLSLLHNETISGGEIFVLQNVDIDAQKKAEAALIYNEQRWNTALQSSGQGVWDHNLRSNEMFYSDTWKQLRGIGADEEIDGALENWIETVHPDDREHVLNSIVKQEACGAQFNVFEYRERHRDGRWVWIESRGATSDWYEDGRPARITGTDTDITERKNTERRLAEISRSLELALEISQIGVFEANIDTGSLHWDDRLLEIYGVTREEISNSTFDWESMLHPDDAERAMRTVADSAKDARPFTNEFRIVRRDGSIRHIRARGAPYIDKSGTHRLIGANWDVTPDIELRAELERSKVLAEQRSDDLEAAKVSIEYNALHDHLTGLPNRRYMDQTLEQTAAECLVSGASVAILHIDLDRFKQINDTLGHQAGDSMLVHVAEVLSKNMRSGDFVARVGGDEFVFISTVAPDQTRKLAIIAGRIIEELRRPVEFNGHLCRFGASIGIACDGPNVDPKQLLINADIALYRAKSLGRNRYEFFSHEIQAQILTTKRVADEILHGIEQNAFVAYYQPQFDAKTFDVVGVETLARWDHPVRGILAPDSFLNIAEDLNVVAVIDHSILTQALNDLKAWQRNGIAIPKVSVNVSSRRLHDPHLADSLRSLNIEPGTVSFELLESIFLDDVDVTVTENLRQIRSLGIDIEIDDFGTGHASIVSLLQLSPRRLKIDRTLVNPIDTSVEQRKLVGSMIEIGRSLGIEVVAEGVETFAHAAILRDLGCDILQGYAFAAAMTAGKLADFVVNEPWRPEPQPVHALQSKISRTI
ncbi:sensor domain-containing protein [Pararhizobium sp.]|uniref:sensor domain-containing protein n=1 Tax=Pararhizobium sp. TaxID=1977563 RepID=UPI002715A4F6|nr:EAL domain-containing protein [Pararhizobium sp.]MDO9417128.1 EAL domain-containing protein [Pararhizobium sp.]